MTHTGKRSNGDNGHKSAGQEKGFLSGAFFFLSLSNLLHEAAHSGSGFVLLLASGVGVGAQGEPGVEVAQHGGHCFHIHTVLQRRGSESMAEVRKLFITTKTKRKKKPGSYRKTKTL